MSSAVQPDRVLRELADLWVSLGKQGEEGGGVLRACAMTLVTVAGAEDDAQDIGETLAGLMRHHPSRMIVIRLDPACKELAARVFAQCWLPFGSRRQICCEQIEIQTPPDGLADAASAVLPLLAADLPVAVWLRHPSLLEHGGVDALFSLGGRLITDSARAETPDRALRRLREALRTGLAAADLAWTRVTRWRELVVQVFANPAYLERAAWLRKIDIWQGGADPHPSARYLAAWLGACLEAAGGAAETAFHAGPPESSISRVSLRGTGLHVELEKVETAFVEVRVDGLSNRAVLQPSSDRSLLNEELSLAPPDRSFLAALDRVCATIGG
jgi:glucose-6-phosphate dehydrogenase assembly protein OpcA